MSYRNFLQGYLLFYSDLLARETSAGRIHMLQVSALAAAMKHILCSVVMVLHNCTVCEVFQYARLNSVSKLKMGIRFLFTKYCFIQSCLMSIFLDVSSGLVESSNSYLCCIGWYAPFGCASCLLIAVMLWGLLFELLATVITCYGAVYLRQNLGEIHSHYAEEDGHFFESLTLTSGSLFSSSLVLYSVRLGEAWSCSTCPCDTLSLVTIRSLPWIQCSASPVFSAEGLWDFHFKFCVFLYVSELEALSISVRCFPSPLVTQAELLNYFPVSSCTSLMSVLFSPF